MIAQIDAIPLGAIRINGGTQSRAELNQVTIGEYAEAIRAAVDLPPVITYFDGAAFWLADGFHRFHAHRAAGATEISAEIRTGTQRDAILHSVGANATHGLRRTNEDKRRAVMTLLSDTEWSTWSDNAIAKACGVSDKTVGSRRAAIIGNSEDAPATTRTVERSGKTYEQNTANIGTSRPSLHSESASPPQTTDVERSTPPHSPVSEVADMAAPTPDEVTTLREQLLDISEHLKSTLADNEMMGRVFDADDQIKAAMTEAIRQKAIAESAERTLAAKTGEFVERARAVTHWMNRAQKAEKALAKLEVQS
jgi:hypothetical protein